MSELRPPQPVPEGDRPGRVGIVGWIAVDLRPLRHRAFRHLWIGQGVSAVGAAISMVAVPYQVYSLTHSTLVVGLLGLAALVPLLVVPIVGGAVADATDRRSLLLRTEAGMAAIAALFLVNASLPHPRVWALFALETAAVAVYSLGRPAMSTLTPRLVPDAEIVAANTLTGVYSSLAAVGGPALGGALIAGVGLPWSFAIDLVTYAASLLVLWALPPLPPSEHAERPSLQSVLDGFRFLSGRQALLGIFVVDTNAMVFGMPMSLFPALALHRYGGNATTLGLLYAAPDAGATVASLASGWTGKVRRQGRWVTVAACAWGAAIAGFGLSTALWPGLALLAVAGGADFYSAVLRDTMLLRSTPDHLRGRLSGIEFAQVAGAPNLGNLEAGVVASLTSLRASVVSGGVLCIVGCVATALALPAFLRYDAARPDEA